MISPQPTNPLTATPPTPPPQIVPPPPHVIADGSDLALDILAAEESLIEFTKQAWKIIEPNEEFKDNWHLDLIASHLEDLYHDPEASDLVINVPPGCMKSLLTCVMWPAWVWAQDPSKRFMGASYSEELSIRDAMKTRDIITSEWYQTRWRHVELKKGEDQKIKYGLTAGGWRLSTSTGGRATGEHPDFKLVDDPHSAAQAQSDAERARALEWFDGTLSTRGVSRGARTIVIMQRLHEKDITGHILEDLGGYDHICIPMRYEGRGTKYSCDADTRTQVGQLLWPDLFPEDTVMILEKRLGEYGASGQLQQQPNPPGGGILKIGEIKAWPSDKDIPPMQYVLQSYDTAFTEKTSGDPTACSVWGVFTYDNKQCVMLLDTWAEHLSYPRLREKVISDWSATYGGKKDDPQNKPRRADLVLVEQKGSGQSILQDLRAANIPARGYNPGRADKMTRAHSIAPILELGCIYIPESHKQKGEFISWARPLLHQMEKFPNAEHDDLCLTANTKIILASGVGIPINCVQVGDLVATPMGPQRVIASGCTNPAAEIVEVQFSDGRFLRGTCAHPVFHVEAGGFVPLGELPIGGSVCTSKSFDTVESTTADTQIAKARRCVDTSTGSVWERMKRYTARCIKTISGIFRLDTMFTTKMGILATTPPATLSACLSPSISSGTSKKTHQGLLFTSERSLVSTGKPSLESVKSRPSSPVSSVGEGFCPSRLIERSFARRGAMTRTTRLGPASAYVRYVVEVIVRLAGRLSAHLHAEKSIAVGRRLSVISVDTPHVGPKVLGVRKLPDAEAVFNLTVEGAHCYFANGILTHNCDTLTQALIYLRDSGLLELEYSELLDEPVEVDYSHPKRENPYAV